MKQKSEQRSKKKKRRMASNLRTIRRKEQEALGLCDPEHDALHLELTASGANRFKVDAEYSSGLAANA